MSNIQLYQWRALCKFPRAVVTVIDSTSLFVLFFCRPDIWLSVRVMKGLKVTEIPLLSSWIHSLIMDIFTTCELCVSHVMSCAGHVISH